MTFVDDFLDRITMYRLVLYYLTALLAAAALLSLLGILPYRLTNLVFSTLFILALCMLTNYAFAAWFRATTNVESVYITAFILALIIAPVAPIDTLGIGFLLLASVGAIASKYLLVFRKKHLFNPAAFGVALPAFLFGQSATWWTDATGPLALLTFVGGLLIVRKLRRFDLVLSFFAVVLLVAIGTAPGGDLLAATARTLQYSSFYFFALVMLTEPLTTPPSRPLRIFYGAFVGLLFVSHIQLGPVYFTLENALLAGNFFAFIVSPKGRHLLTLVEKKEIAPSAFEFAFSPDRPFPFRPGQYLEWTLGHRPSDARGNRRFFTIASSPTEKLVRLGAKTYEPGSSFKKALLAMRVGDYISTGCLAGDFILPKDTREKLAFIAGGIGITPFRSMAQYLADMRERRDIVLFYSARSEDDFAYREVFERAKGAIGMKTVYTQRIDRPLIEREAPDYRDRTFYLSGPHGMVVAFETTLREMGVPRSSIRTDHFPGYA